MEKEEKCVKSEGSDASCLHESVRAAGSFYRAQARERDGAERNRAALRKEKEEKGVKSVGSDASCLHESVCAAGSFYRA